MHPIVWLPLTNIEDRYNPSPLEVMRDNKGTAPIHKSDIKLTAQPNTEQSLFGINPSFDTKDSLDVDMGKRYSVDIWSGFSITFFVNINDEPTAWDEIIEFTNGNIGGISHYVTFGICRGKFYIGTSWLDEDQQFFESAIVNTWLSVAIVCKNKIISAYINGSLKKSFMIPCYNYEGNLSLIHNAGSRCSLFNLKLYNEAISMRRILQDYSCMCAHWKFDGTSSDDPEYIIEYDSTGFGFDARANENFTVTSTFSPSRQYSTVMGGDFEFTLPRKSFVTAWVYITENVSWYLQYGHLIVTINRNNKAISLQGDTPDVSMQGKTGVLDSGTWHFMSTLYDTYDKRLEIYLDGELEIDCIYPSDYNYAGGIPECFSCIGDGAVVSDVRVFINKPTDEELKYLMNREVTIDEKGTIYATELQMVDYMTTFAFGDRGQIMSPSFESPEYSNNKGVMDYDYRNNVLKIRDFEET